MHFLGTSTFFFTVSKVHQFGIFGQCARQYSELTFSEERKSMLDFFSGGQEPNMKREYARNMVPQLLWKLFDHFFCSIFLFWTVHYNIFLLLYSCSHGFLQMNGNGHTWEYGRRKKSNKSRDNVILARGRDKTSLTPSSWWPRKSLIFPEKRLL